MSYEFQPPFKVDAILAKLQRTSVLLESYGLHLAPPQSCSMDKLGESISLQWSFRRKSIAMNFSIGEVTRWQPIVRPIRFVGGRVPNLCL